MVDDRVGERREGERRATIKAHSTHPNHPRPYGSPSLLPLSLASVDAYWARFIAPKRHQPKNNPISFRRGEGGGVAWGGPLWSPAYPGMVDDRVGERREREGGGNIKAHSTHPNHPRPYGSPSLLPLSLASVDAFCRTFMVARRSPSSSFFSTLRLSALVSTTL